MTIVNVVTPVCIHEPKNAPLCGKWRRLGPRDEVGVSGCHECIPSIYGRLCRKSYRVEVGRDVKASGVPKVAGSLPVEWTQQRGPVLR